MYCANAHISTYNSKNTPACADDVFAESMNIKLMRSRAIRIHTANTRVRTTILYIQFNVYGLRLVIQKTNTRVVLDASATHTTLAFSPPRVACDEKHRTSYVQLFHVSHRFCNGWHFAVRWLAAKRAAPDRPVDIQMASDADALCWNTHNPR